MQTRRGTVLGKRGHHESSSVPAAKAQVVCEQLRTPESSPILKRPRTSLTLEADGSNKENIPPLKDSLISGESTPPRRLRALRRSATEDITPPRLGIQRSVSTSSLPPSTPIAATSSFAIATPPPTPPIHLLPLHTRIRALLRSTCNNTHIPITGRESERDTILNFVKSFINATAMNHDQLQSSMFISGPPGTGKTALVTRIVHELTAEHSGDLRIISINCMALKTLDTLWERMIDELDLDAFQKPSAGKKAKGREAVEALLQTTNLKYILILDELDHITPNEHSLSSIFTLTESLPSTLRLIGIANTHTLTASASNPFVGSTGVQTVHFTPYTPIELQEILGSRLASLSNDDSSKIATDIRSFLPKAAIMLLTKKVAALTGDVRCLFEVLRGAIDIAVGASLTNLYSNENPLDTQPPTITPQYILAAFKAYLPSSTNSKSQMTATSGTSVASNNEVLAKVRNLGLQARLVLLSMIIASKRLGAGLSLSQITSSPKKLKPAPIKRSVSMPNPSTTPYVGIDTGSLNAFYNLILSRAENGIFEAVSRGEFGDLIGVLEGVGLVSLSSSTSVRAPRAKKSFGRSTSFGTGLAKNGVGSIGEVRLVDGIWEDEVLRCLGANVDTTSSDPREEEIHTIWEREKSRLSRDMKAATRSKDSGADVFSGAFQR